MRERTVLSVVMGVLAAMAPSALATVYGPGIGGPVPDAVVSHITPGVLNSDIAIDAQGTIASVDGVTVIFGTPNHTWVGDLQIILTAPNGDNVHLISRPGANGPTGFGDSSDFGGTYLFVNSGGANFTALLPGVPATQPVPPGTYNRETNPLAGATVGVDNDDFTVFAGDAIRGTWKLTVKDWGVGDTGSLNGWNLNVSLVPSPGSLALLGLAGLVGIGRRRR